ncbi:MAG: hypothetical protein OSJ69_17725 [Acetatifactor sp.]|nr:hypothetical protein [Acetatifactor sp.]
MIDLRNYKDYIRELVAEENRKDKNWRWSVKSIGKNRIRIRWGYLDYLEEENNCFIIDLDSSTPDMECLCACWPDRKLMECYLVVEGKPNPQLGAEQTIKSGLRDAVWEIAYTAHNYY